MEQEPRYVNETSDAITAEFFTTHVEHITGNSHSNVRKQHLACLTQWIVNNSSAAVITILLSTKSMATNMFMLNASG